MNKYIITDKCLYCGACADACKKDAIYEENNKFEIDENKCIGCGYCARICPVNAPEQKV